jgi:hypothetical protein
MTVLEVQQRKKKSLRMLKYDTPSAIGMQARD